MSRHSFGYNAVIENRRMRGRECVFHLLCRVITAKAKLKGNRKTSFTHFLKPLNRLDNCAVGKEGFNYKIELANSPLGFAPSEVENISFTVLIKL